VSEVYEEVKLLATTMEYYSASEANSSAPPPLAPFLSKMSLVHILPPSNL
jgi:hypothetical protein